MAIVTWYCLIILLLSDVPDHHTSIEELKKELQELRNKVEESNGEMN